MTQEEIEKAAAEQLANTDPEALKRFLEHYALHDADGAPADERTPSEEARIDVGAANLPNDAIPIPASDFAAHRESLARATDAAIAHLVTSGEAGAQSAAQQIAAYIGDAACERKIKAYLQSYADVGGAEAGGDVYRHLITDLRADSEDVRMRRQNFALHTRLSDLSAALCHPVGLKFEVPLVDAPAFGRQFPLDWNTPLIGKRQLMLISLVDFLIAGGAFAYDVKSDSLPLWRSAYLLVYKTMGGPNATPEQIRRAFDRKTAEKVVELVSTAHDALFADCVFQTTAREYWEEV